MPFLVSTMTAGVDYTFYGKAEGNNLKPILKKISIKGGANIANKSLLTPRGTVTKISNEDLADLEKHAIYQLHKKAGHIKVLNSDPSQKVEAVAKDMKAKDASAPKTDADFPKDKGPKLNPKAA